MSNVYVEDVEPLPVNHNDQRSHLPEECSVASLRPPTVGLMGTEPQLQNSSTISEGMAGRKPTKIVSTAETLADGPMQSSSSRGKPAPTTPTRKMICQASQCEVDARTPQKRAKYTCACGEI